MVLAVIEMPVIRMEQGELVFYSGVIPTRQLLDIYDVDRWHREELEDGYQRELYKERALEIAKFIGTCTVPIIPPILASLREGVEFEPGEGATGVLKVPLRRQAVWVIDGQHRVGGFARLKEELERVRHGELPSFDLSPEKLESCLEFPISVLFLDTQASLSRVKEQIDPEVRGRITLEDLERVFFLIVNETARRLRPSNRDRISYRLVRIGFKGIPVIERRGIWRTDAAELVAYLTRPGMPLEGLINITGARGSGRPIQLSSFIDSLEGLLTNPAFIEKGVDTQREFLRLFWEGLKSRLPLAFSPDKKVRNRFFMLRTIVVRALNEVANDIFNYWCEHQVSEKMCAPLDILAQYNWDRRTCPISAYGGQKGVREAHKALLWWLYKHDQPEAKQALMNYGWWDE